MAGAQPVLGDCHLDGVGDDTHLALLETAILVGTETQAVEDSGDAGSHHLRVMRLEGGDRVPAHAGARRIMGFEMIGMEFDQAWDHIVAFAILARRDDTGIDRRDLAAAQHKRPVDDLVFEDDARILQNDLLGHLRRTFWFRAAAAAGRNAR